MEKKWGELSPGEKREERFRRWLSPEGVKFVSPEAEELYRVRVTRLIDVIKLQEPDRVPVSLPADFAPAYYYGATPYEAMYNGETLRELWKRYMREFEMDIGVPPGGVCSGRVLDILDNRQYKWPGHGLPAGATYQYIEGEYMKADEYDHLIQDPSDFWLRVYLPRIFGALEPLRELMSLTNILELPPVTASLAPYGRPEVQAALQALLTAGREAAQWDGILQELGRDTLELGIPSMGGGGARAPFDFIGDTLRGTQGIMMDMYRQPDKLREALDRIAITEISRAITGANDSGRPVIHMPLHKGADGFMSEKQFNTFYWPSLKKLLLGLIDEGLVPFMFAEGSYDSRLEIIRDLPRGTVIWMFDRTDMARAKEVLGDNACIMGNVPASLLCTGTAEEVKEYCRKLIGVAGKGGGFILSPGAGINELKRENMLAMMEAAKEYGVYR